jgi:zinc transporter ZupT
VAGLADVLGALILTGRRRWDPALLKYFLAVGAGFMLAAAFVRMLPESVEKLPHAFFFVLLGYFGIHLFEHTVAPHFHFGEEVHHEALLRPSVGYLAVVGLGVHTFFDGVAIRSGFVIGPTLGVLLFAAVLLHKLPEGVAVSSLLAGAYSVHILARRFSAGERSALLAFGGKVAVAGVLALGAAAMLSELVGAYAGSDWLAEDVSQLVVGSLGAAVMYVAALLALNVHEVEALVRRAREWLAAR